MQIQLNIGASEVLDQKVEHDTEFGFSVVFDNGERAEITFEPDLVDAYYVHAVRCSMYAADDGPLLKREILVGS